MNLMLIAAICAALWLVLALAGREIEKRWEAPRLGGRIGKEATLAALKAAMALVKIAALTYGALLLLLFLLPLLGARMTPADYETVLSFLTPVRGVLSFFSGGIGQICFGIAIAVLASRTYHRYRQARLAAKRDEFFSQVSRDCLEEHPGATPLGKAARQASRRHLNPGAAPRSENAATLGLLPLIGQFLAGKVFFRQAKLLAKYSSNFATIVFCLSLVGASGVVVDQAFDGEGVPSPDWAMNPGNVTVESSKGEAKESTSVAAPKVPAAEQGKSDQSSDDPELRRLVAAALVDAFAESPFWNETIHTQMEFDQTPVPDPAVASAAIDLVEGLIRADPAKIPLNDGRFSREFQALLARNIKRHETRELGNIVLDGILGTTIEEITPEASDGAAGKAQKLAAKAGKTAVGKYLEAVLDKFAVKFASGASLFDSLREIRTLHHLELAEKDLSEISRISAEAETERKKASEAAAKVEEKPQKPGAVSRAAELLDEAPAKPNVASTARDAPPLGVVGQKPSSDVLLRNGNPWTAEQRALGAAPGTIRTEVGVAADALCVILRAKFKAKTQCRAP
jgi:hypothetical protein